MTKNLADDLQRTARQALTGLAPSEPGEEAGGLPFRRLLAAAFRARYLVIATTLFGTLIGAFLALTTPNTYSSEGMFVFTGTGAEAISVDPTRATDANQEAISNTASYILTSNDLMAKVVERLTPARILEPYQPGTGADTGAKGWFYRIQRDYNATNDLEASPEEALKRLQRSISLERPRGTNVLQAKCTANNPQLAQQILNVFLEESVQFHITQYEDQSAYAEAEKRHKETSLALEKARLGMREFLDRTARVSEFDDEKKLLQRAETAAATTLSTVRNEVNLKRETLARLVKRLDVDKDIVKEIKEKRRADTTSTALRELEQAWGRAQRELVAIEPKYTDPNADEIVEKKALISNLEQTMARVREKARLAPEEEFNVPNPEFVAANDLRNKLMLDVTTLDAQLLLAERMHTEAKANLKALLDLEPQFAQLRDTQIAAEDAAKTANFLWNAAQEKRSLALGKFSSLRIFQRATLPLEKQGPNRSRILLGAFFAGLFFGLGVVILRALPDSVVRTRDDLEKVEGLAVIGVMPRLDGANLRRHVALREQGW